MSPPPSNRIVLRSRKDKAYESPNSKNSELLSNRLKKDVGSDIDHLSVMSGSINVPSEVTSPSKKSKPGRGTKGGIFNKKRDTTSRMSNASAGSTGAGALLGSIKKKKPAERD